VKVEDMELDYRIYDEAKEKFNVKLSKIEAMVIVATAVSPTKS
jgi:hypothetical protein